MLELLGWFIVCVVILELVSHLAGWDLDDDD